MTRLAPLLMPVLAVGLLLASSAAAQGPRVEPPPAGALVGPGLGGPVDSTVPPSVPAEPPTPDLVVDLSRARVSITSAFQGESILMFGMFDPPGEIVVVVAGPAGRETAEEADKPRTEQTDTDRHAHRNRPMSNEL